MERLLEIMRRLRAPDGCPWDREQSHESLRPHLLEEAAEAVDALEHGGTSDVVEELGDVLLQIAFHAVIAEEDGSYDYADIEDAIVTKLVRRHPHVFGDRRARDANEVLANWESIKAEERAAVGRAARPKAESVPRALPALKRAAALGEALDWAVRQEDAALAPRDLEARPEGIGRMLLAAAQVARRAGVDPELALRDAIEERAATETT